LAFLGFNLKAGNREDIKKPGLIPGVQK